MKKIYFVVLLIALTFISESKSADAVFECNGCTSTQYRQKALSVIPPTATYGVYDVYISDLLNENIKRYKVYLESDPAFPGGVSKFAVSVNPEAYYLNLFSDYLKAYKDYKLAKGLSTTEWPDPDTSAFDLRGGANTQLESSISSYIYDNANWLTKAAIYIDTAVLLVGKLADITVVEIVEFADGSTIEMAIVGFYGGDIVFEYLEGTAKDANGNSIPDNQAAFNGYYGQFQTHDNSLVEFLNYASSMGIPITYSGSGDTVTVTCYLEGDTYRCVYKRTTE